jgi:phenylpropionate dioxygenase-like ring-hydroxylating dioxygenase large terminal subunit
MAPRQKARITIRKQCAFLPIDDRKTDTSKINMLALVWRISHCHRHSSSRPLTHPRCGPLDCRDGRDGGSEVIGVHKWIFPANWKFAAENFLGDTYHNPSHRSVDMVGIGPSAASGTKGRRDDEMAKPSTSGSAFHRGMEYTVRCSRQTTPMYVLSSTIPKLTHISASASRSASVGSATRHV